MVRIFTRDIGGFRAGQKADLDWDSVHRSLQQFHGAPADITAFTITEDEVVQRFIAGLNAETRKASRADARRPE